MIPGDLNHNLLNLNKRHIILQNLCSYGIEPINKDITRYSNTNSLGSLVDWIAPNNKAADKIKCINEQFFANVNQDSCALFEF